jgi:hypothetical protein
MIIKCPELVIDPDKPFALDKLGREDAANILTDIIKTIDHPFVLAIDSKWGTGKTTFINMWKSHLINSGFVCMYFNAWENDFVDDPFIAFIAEIQNEVENILNNTTVSDPLAIKAYLEKARNIGWTLLKNILPVATKIATSGLLDMEVLKDSLGEVAKDVKDVISEKADEYINRKISEHEDAKRSIVEFRKTLSELVKNIQESSGNNFPMIFFIDELDRCKPTYAIKLLERLKHLFNVYGIVYVVSIDKTQVSCSVRSVYGDEMDADGYLRRFIDLEYQLPEPSMEDYCRHLFSVYGFEDIFEHRGIASRSWDNDKSNLLKTFSMMSKIFDLSLRDQEQCFARMYIVLKSTKPEYAIYPELLALLVVIHAADRNLYKKYIAKKDKWNEAILNTGEVLNSIKSRRYGKELFEAEYGDLIEGIMYGGVLQHNMLNEAKKYFMDRSQNQKLLEVERKRDEEINRVLEYMHRNRYHDAVYYLERKIELAERFQT